MVPDQFWEKIFNYGLPTTLLVAMAFLFVWFVKSHKEERKEWREQTQKQFEAQDRSQAETNTVLRQLTAVIERIKS